MLKMHKKIDVFIRQHGKGGYIYLHSTCAYKTCREAVSAAKIPGSVHTYRAWFAK